MHPSPATVRRLLFGLAFAAMLGGALLWRVQRDRGTEPSRGNVLAKAAPARPGFLSESDTFQDNLSEFDRLLAALRPATGTRGARPNEAVLTFKDADAFQRFLAAASAAGLDVRGRIDGLLTMRVGAGSLADLARGLLPFIGDLQDAGANPYVFTPQPPPVEERAAQRHQPFGDRTLAFLGIEGDHRLWGRGVTIAVIDSGIAGEASFGAGRIRHLDLGLGTRPLDGHGTAVAALAAGDGTGTTGVAPAASLLSVRVTDADGLSDTFTVAQAIVAAVDAGAQVLNISLGAYQNHSTLTRALDYAFAQGAVVVASAGNDQAGVLTWPAADPRVISVGAVDALEQQVTFSNSGDTLRMAAPGYGITTAWLDETRVSFSGTSASAPLVTGAIAAVMSQSPGLSAAQAWKVLATHSSEAGPPGSDPHYGQGILNVGWAMARTDPTRLDTAVASHHFNESTGQLEVVVQNRSNQGLAGLQLSVQTNAGTSTNTLRWLAPGATSVVTVPVDQTALKAGKVQIFRSELLNPGGMQDAIPSNNRKTSSLQANP